MSDTEEDFTASLDMLLMQSTLHSVITSTLLQQSSRLLDQVLTPLTCYIRNKPFKMKLQCFDYYSSVILSAQVLRICTCAFKTNINIQACVCNTFTHFMHLSDKSTYCGYGHIVNIYYDSKDIACLHSSCQFKSYFY